MSNALPMIASVASLALGVNASAALAADAAKVKSVVLVHCGFVDGSGWEGVYDLLKKDGYDVTIVQNPTTSLADDVAVTKRAIAAAPGKVILVGHSYGGVVASEAGTDPKVAGIVYIAAFAPDAGESAASLIANPPRGAPVPPILPPVDGFLLLDKAKFTASFAADVRPDLASFMAASQVPWGVGALDGKVTAPTWKVRPSWYLVTTDDRMIPPAAQRKMANRAGAITVETPGSHAVYVSNPGAVANLIQQAAANVKPRRAKLGARSCGRARSIQTEPAPSSVGLPGRHLVGAQVFLRTANSAPRGATFASSTALQVHVEWPPVSLTIRWVARPKQPPAPNAPTRPPAASARRRTVRPGVRA